MESIIYSILIWYSSLSFTIDIADNDVKNNNQIDNHIELAISKGKSCIDCHSDIMEAKRKHQPAVDDCQKCHVKNSNNHPQQGVKGFNLAGEKSVLCFTCHTGLKEKKNLHQPSNKGQCVECHSPHSSNNKKLVLEKKVAKLCFKCHQMEIGEEDVVHNPVESGRCNKCHDSHQSEFESFLKWDMPGLCYNCHDGIAEEMNMKRVHTPAKEDCFKCHDAHNAKESYLLTDSVPNLCYTCHKDIKTKKNIHQPAADGKCLTCHNTHGSKNKKLLVEKKTDKICSQCHQLDIKEGDYVHNPVGSGRCHKCHDSHQSDFSAFLKFEKDELCFRCHSEMKERKDTVAFVHKSLNVKQKCSNCHSPHASKEPAFLLKNEREMCLTCHNRTFASKTGKVENIEQILRRSKTIHAPVKEGCINCHNPHTSEINSLLVDKFPEGEYAYAEAKNFALCFKCHNSAILENPFSDTITNFRNGNENMHYVHVQGHKGRNCKICHNIHGSENENLINLTASFGDWKMNMNYKSTHDGGSCNTGCHGKKEYNRKQKFINDPDFDITSIKKYSDHIEEFIKVEKKIAENAVVKKEKTEIADKDSISKKEVAITKVDEKIPDVDEKTIRDTLIKDETVVIDEEKVAADTIAKREEPETKVEERTTVNKVSKEEKVIISEEKVVKDAIVKKEEVEAKADEEYGYRNISKDSTDNKQQTISKNGLNRKEKDVLKEQSQNKTETNTHQVFKFEYASDTLIDETENQVVKLVEYLKKMPQNKIEIHGHADTFGSNRYNYLISKKRAENIKRLLVVNGVDASRINVKYHGSKRPAASNETDEGRAKNRRVEIFVKN